MTVIPDAADAFASVTNPWLQGAFAPVFDERDDHDLEVTGHLPGGLRGSFLRNGPNALFPPLGGYHLFDGDGMIHGLTFDGDGGASYANRWIRSAGLEAEIAAGGALFGGLTDFRLPPDDVFATVGPMKNTANTHVVRHAGRILALMEAAPPTELTADLATVGEHRFGGALQGPMTAHPKVDPRTGEMVFFGTSPFPPHLRIHGASADGTLTWTTEVDLPGSVMMHDFVITETRVVVFDLPAVLDVDAMLTGGTGIYWAPERGARIGVLERGAPGSTIRWIEVDPFWVFHFMNAFDDGDAIEVVGCRSTQLNTSFDGSEVDADVRPMLYRWRIDPVAGTFTEHQLDDRPTDFPRINDQRAGRTNRYGYSGHSTGWADDEPPFDGVIKHDFSSGTTATHLYGPDTVCGEAVFTPDPAGAERADGGDEDRGWLLNFVHDLSTDRSSVVVLDAATLEEAARVHLPRRVPFGFHGSFLA
ncbi:carotenoid oxygenase family protein [Aquihabitans sp. McL0605]|uniref:carotenoid oxygenase family protein n=1 Tax=Aquihabitans sp. McL0605 TaxID=3415671 RepID=UPI003CEA973D